jgi:hypothetical protein
MSVTQGERREGHWKCLTTTLACVIIQSNLVTIAFAMMVLENNMQDGYLL